MCNIPAPLAKRIDKLENYVKQGRFSKPDFPASLVSQYRRKGYLSDRQEPWVTKLIEQIENPPPPPMKIDFRRVFEYLHKAKNLGSKGRVWLVDADGQPVVLSIAGEFSKMPGTINVTDGGPFGDNQWYGRIGIDGMFTPSKQCRDEVIAVVTQFDEEPIETAKHYARVTSRCTFCGTQITSEESLAVGYGPICASRYGLPWG